MKKLVIFGPTRAGAQSLYDFRTDSPYEVAAFAANRADIREPEFQGLPVVPFEEVETLYPPAEHDLFVAVYYNRMNAVRRQKFGEARAKGYRLASYVSTKAIVWPDLKIGENCMICDGANVRPYAMIGEDTFVMPGAVVGHDAVVGDHSYLAIHAVLLAGASVGSGCVIGANATILNGVKVADECLVGAAVVINKNTKEKGVYTAAEPTLQALPSDKLANVLFRVQV